MFNPKERSNYLEKKWIFLIIQFLCIFSYLFVFFGNFNILFLKIILGIIFLLFIPGYNLINILFPEFSIKVRLGLCSVFSLGLEVLIMLIYYIVGVSLPNSNPFFFDINILVILFSILSVLLILIYFFKYSDYGKISMNTNGSTKRIYLKFKNNKFYVILTLIFFIDLILLCFNVYLNRVSLTRSQIISQYSENFTFFYYCDFYFYIFYSIAIILLIFFAVKFQNKILFISLVCLFLYSQLIIPYLQIGDFFVYDAIFLEDLILSYNNYGLTPMEKYGGLIINLGDSFWGLRYITSTFFGILLINFTGTDIFFSLSFLYSISICLTPFLIYGLLEYLSNNSNKKDNSIKILTLFAIFNPIFLKFGHTATTVVIGFNIFIILIFLLYIIFKTQILSIKNILVIIFLYSFLSFTHIEETLYFLLILFVVEVFFIIFIEKESKHSNFLSRSINGKSFIKKYCFLNGILVLLFYVSQEFLGHFDTYISYFNNFPLFNFIFTLYSDSKILSFPFIFERHVSLSLFIIIICFLIPILMYILFFLINFYKSKLANIKFIFVNFFNKLQKFLTKRKISSGFQLILIISLILTPIFLNFLIGVYGGEANKILELDDILIILEVIILYNYFIIQIFIFIKNLLFYKQNKLYEFFVLLILICLTGSIGIFALSSISIGFIVYELQKFIYLLIFFNVFLIKENYFVDLRKKKFKYFFMLIFIMIIGGLNISFRKLKFG